jgi:hypothetical protein
MKLQFWSMDMIFAIVIFAITMVILTYVWFNVSQQFSITYSNAYGNMQSDMQQLTNRLLTTGTPSNWYYSVDPANLSTWTNTSIGLASSTGGRLSEAKIAKLYALSLINYDASKQLLGVSYNYYIVIYSPQLYNLTIGPNPLAYNATTVVVQDTPVILDNGVPAELRVMLWTTSQTVSVSTTTVYTTASTSV